ncbi:D-aminopeptidase [Falsiroseomonas selenitidurans]|uniref:D-aminopeptidase n=1 Tax=Falsiroseomonas selenitidurans TaxID=2716335 RepID=A0ABX1E835_9PROT|nr:D-aminopeptidase [Falsiroseomonas selenitidurans]NKC33361.1 D-aminopeptidase [Falsiroseomonas selenitidurans]
MSAPFETRLDPILRDLPRRYPGPGGAIAVLREGAVLVRHAWGYANAERRIPFTPRTLFRLCSITKQFTCGAMLAAVGQPEALDAAIRARLPLLGEAAPPARLLAHNQSGLRDYWAVAMLHGAPAESAFGEVEAARVIAGTSSLHFAPGTRYAYCNQNFRLISDALQDVTGRSFSELLRRHIFGPVGMESAFLAAETRSMPDGTEGYEGSQATGFRPAVNRVIWTGDAGLGASLDDLIAWERHIDARRDDPDSLHARLAAPVAFADGSPAPYGFGLGRGEALGTPILGHGGALRGWRSHRLHAPAERVSVVVMFNHLSDANAAAMEALAAVLGAATPQPDATLPPPDWLGAYREPETGLAVRLDASGPGAVRLRFGHGAERLELRPDGGAGTGRTRLRPVPGGLWMDRPQENQASLLMACPGEAQPGIAGRYRCAELEAELLVTEAGGVAYGGFSGFLGQGRMELLEPIGPDLWALPCWRALDHTPPGDWTLAFRRGPDGAVTGVGVGCWLARGLSYERVG